MKFVFFAFGVKTSRRTHNYRFSVEPRISAAAAAALFFSSEAETPDSDPECEQPEELWREMVQNVTVGVLSAFLGDMV